MHFVHPMISIHTTFAYKFFVKCFGVGVSTPIMVRVKHFFVYLAKYVHPPGIKPNVRAPAGWTDSVRMTNIEYTVVTLANNPPPPHPIFAQNIVSLHSFFTKTTRQLETGT